MQDRPGQRFQAGGKIALHLIDCGTTIAILVLIMVRKRQIISTFQIASSKKLNRPIREIKGQDFS